MRAGKYLIANFFPHTIPYTLSQKCLSGHSSLCYETTLSTGGVGRSRAAPYLKIEDVFVMALGSKCSNFQINGASGATLETLRPPILTQIRGADVCFRVSLKLL